MTSSANTVETEQIKLWIQLKKISTDPKKDNLETVSSEPMKDTMRQGGGGDEHQKHMFELIDKRYYIWKNAYLDQLDQWMHLIGPG